jgi:hypothetical protein
MTTTRRLYAGAAALALCVGLTAPGLAGAQQSDYVLEVLVSVPFGPPVGQADSQIALSWNPNEGSTDCVTGFAVDASDNVYLGDKIAGKVKKFASPGKLVMATGPAPQGAPGVLSDGTLDSLRDFSVDQEGNVYVIHSESDVLSKFSSNGHWLWSKRYREVLPRELADNAALDYQRHDFLFIFATADGSLVIGVPRRGYVADPAKRVAAVVVDPEGSAIGELVAYPQVLSRPHKLAEAAPAPELRNGAVTIRDVDCAVVGRANLDLSADGGIHFQNCFEGPMPYPFRDCEGSFYTLSLARPTAQVPRLYTGLEYVFNKFDRQGCFVEEWRFLRSVFDARPEAAPDSEGNIYHIRFDEWGLEVVRYRRIPEGSAAPAGAEVIGGGRIHELVSLRVADTTITPLVLLAAKANLPVEWNPQTRVATVTTKAGPLVLDPDRNRATLAGEPVQISGPLSIRYGRLWVPAVQVARLLELPIRESEDKRIVCLAWPR